VSTSTSDAHTDPPFRRLRPAAWLLVGVAVVIVVLVVAVKAFVGIYTNLLWFDSVRHHSVDTRILGTEIALFAIFGLLTAAAVAANLVVVRHFRRPDFAPDPARQRWRYRFIRHVEPRRRWLFAIAVVVLGYLGGSRATGYWQYWLQWRHAVSFGQRDPQFHRDISYFVFVYPFHRAMLTLAFRLDVTCLLVVLVAAYLYGGARLRGTGPRVTRAVRAQVSLLLGILLVLKALAYWLDRLGLATSSRGVVTGPSYTDVHAVLPDKLVLLVIAGLCAAMLFANVAVRDNRLMWTAIGVMAASALVFGVAVPALIQQFRVKPSASTLELPYIHRNIVATRAAFGLSGSVQETPYGGAPAPGGKALLAQAGQAAQVRLLDPKVISPTFTQLQQERSFYGFKSPLDVDRYPVAGQSRDVVLGVRELQQSGLSSSQQTWTNKHIVYTHGYGVVAAPTDTLDQQGQPSFVQSSLPSTGALGSFQQRIYYGQMSPSYSIVGAPKGRPPREFDRPAVNGSTAVAYTHVGGGGVPIGSTFRRLAYAVKLGSTSVLFSGDVNRDSQLLYVRNPRARVAKVAPWLTLDGDVYPTVVNGRLLWVVDGYTTASTYPYSQQQNLRSDTSTTLTRSSTTASQPNTSVNYIRNSVKATVDAYSGAVTLYAWNQSGSQRDPVLETWEKAFPGLVKPQSAMPAALVSHLRYPTDLFNVQRTVLSQYHVTDAASFYGGSDFWKIPSDPTVGSSTTTNAVGKTVTTSAPTQPSTYMTLSPDGTSPAVFALSSPLVTLNKRNLAAFLSVDSQPGPGYGKLELLTLPPSQPVEGPAQIQNDIESNNDVAQELTLLRGGKSKIVLGNLLSIPLGGRILYVEPIYEQASGSSSFPVLQYVIADYDSRIGFDPSLSSALAAALVQPAAGSSSGSSTTSPAAVAALAAVKQADAALTADLGNGDTAAYARDEQTLRRAIARLKAVTGSG
jgi:hypothetical protein